MAFYLAHSNSDSAVLPRSEVPENFIPAQATARVTTFSFPLFILSGAPPGRLLKPVEPLFSSPRRLGKSYLENCLARRSSKLARFSFGQPCSGVRGGVYHKAHFTSSVFLRKSFQNPVFPVLSAPISCGLEQKNNFNTEHGHKSPGNPTRRGRISGAGEKL